MSVTVCTPSIPPRAARLAEAIHSVQAQTRKPEAHVIAVDHQGDGEAVTRNRALIAAETEWVAFLDDDDLLYPHHLDVLLKTAAETGADVIYPWFDVQGGSDPLGAEGKPFDPDALRVANYIPVTTLVRRKLAIDVGGFPMLGPGGLERCVDWGFLLALLDHGAKFFHVPERTWQWTHWDGNMSGRRWR